MSVDQETVRLSAVSASAKKHPVRRLGSWIAGAALLAVVAAALAVAIVPMIAGATPLTVLSGSMEPTLHVGSTVVVRPQQATTIHAGDIITFTDREPGTNATRTVTHRVVEALPGPVFRTKGDANNAPDVRTVAAADVHGVFWYDVPLVGLIKDRLISPFGALLALGVVLLGVAIHLLVPQNRPERERWRPSVDHNRQAPQARDQSDGVDRR
jgi:signal peptidase I